jgi:hypothetical protein
VAMKSTIFPVMTLRSPLEVQPWRWRKYVPTKHGVFLLD